MPRLLRDMRENYDCVIIDSTPLLAMAETRLLAPMVDKVLFAVKWGSTRRDVAQSALGMLNSGGVFGKNRLQLAGAIVTQVNLKKHARYRYGGIGESLAKYR